jgi:peptidylglycine monooxygenase
VSEPQNSRVVLAGIHYEVIRNWGVLPAGMVPARVSQVAVDSQSRLYVLRRGPASVQVFSPNGEFLLSFGESDIFDGHGITIDAQDRVFIVDRDAHQVLAFSPTGNLLFSLGERHSPQWEAPFNHPTKVAVAPDGEIYVADGYGNARIHRFSPDGKYLASFGSVGHGPGHFMTPHAILIDQQNRLIVADRENNRVQLFDRAGKYLASLDGLCRPMDLVETADGILLVTDVVPSLNAFAPDGIRIGRCRPSLNGAHGIAGDAQGNFYLAEIDPSSVTKMARL